MASASALSAVLGILICLVFNQTFNWKPFKRRDDNTLAIILTYSLSCIFLGALVLKLDTGNETVQDVNTLGSLLVVILVVGPVVGFIQTFFSLKRIYYRVQKKRLLLKTKTALELSINEVKTEIPQSMDLLELDVDLRHPEEIILKVNFPTYFVQQTIDIILY